jgi:hypothetical protein
VRRLSRTDSFAADIIPSRLEGETNHQTDHDDHGHQTEEDDALPHLGAKIIVRLFADDSRVGRSTRTRLPPRELELISHVR